MLIKAADDQSALIEHLERRAAGTGADAAKAKKELSIRLAGLKGERDSAYLIDFDYAPKSNWAVIHDLRLEHAGRVAQLDHVLINRWMDVYVLESKHFNAGVKITETGEFMRWNSYTRSFEGMPSPIEQNERHIQVLKDVMAEIDLPTRLGVRISPAFQSFVLIAAGARVDRPKGFDSSRVIKADQLKKAIWRDIDGENSIVGLVKFAAKIVSPETMRAVAEALAARHTPLEREFEPRRPTTPVAVPRSPPRAINPPTPPRSQPSPSASTSTLTCKKCRASEGQVLYGKFGYYLKCSCCDTNTSIRFTCAPGHAPRLRKAGDQFYRECADCGSSSLIWRNTN